MILVVIERAVLFLPCLRGLKRQSLKIQGIKLLSNFQEEKMHNNNGEEILY